MDGFQEFAKAVNMQLNAMMANGECYRVQAPEDIFTNYLLSFPAGTDPMFRQRTTHDCSCCKQFVRGFGTMVSLGPNGVKTIWDHFEDFDEPYRTVARHMSQLIKQQPIVGIWRTKETGYGAERTTEQANGHVWNHFWGKTKRNFTCSDPEAQVGAHKTQHDMLKTMMETFTLDAFNTVLDLIKEDELYRGAEHRTSTMAARDLKKAYDASSNKSLWLWSQAEQPISRYKNTVIGTLINDISTGVPVEDAVRMFESKVAPANYKRPKAVVTQKMIENAFSEIEELGLETALIRRHATEADMNVNDVLFVDNAVKSKMRGSLKDQLLSEVPQQVRKLASLDLDIEKFVSEVLPNVESMEVKFEGRNINKLMSLTAPVDQNVKPIFKWDNNFAWSYNGEVTDSIKEKVKKAGGNVNAKLRVSLAWFNYDDLDLHCHGPDGHVFYGNPAGHYRDRYGNSSNRILDVDMNAGGGSPGRSGSSREPVENLSWEFPKDGIYKIEVHQYHRMETRDEGFHLQFNLNGETREYAYRHGVRGTIDCLTFKIQDGHLTTMGVGKDLVLTSAQTMDVWGIKTNTMVPVKTMLLSPNHWEHSNKIGNKHWFFILKGCVNPDEVRGIYNEFLRADLEKHRRVFELLGARTKCVPVPNQLSGLGFTRGRGDAVSVLASLRNKAQVNYKISF
jgi:hypothetical protein